MSTVATTHPYDDLTRFDAVLGDGGWSADQLLREARSRARDAKVLIQGGDAVDAGGYARIAVRLSRAALQRRGAA